MVELADLHEARLAALAEGRAALSSELGAAVASGAAAAPLAAGALSKDDVSEGQCEVVEALNAHLRRERAAIILHGLVCCALFSPAQFCAVSTRASRGINSDGGRLRAAPTSSAKRF